MSEVNIGEQPLEVRGTRTVDFYGDQITAAEGVDTEIYVPVGPLSTFLGLDRSAQRRRIQRDPVLAKRMRTLKHCC